MEHEPAVEWKKDRSAAKKAKLGVVMVLIYTVIYGGFVTINIVNPKIMKIDIGSLNMAIVLGFGLIVLALVQAVIYNHYCTRLEEKYELEDEAEFMAANLNNDMNLPREKINKNSNTETINDSSHTEKNITTGVK